MENYLFLVRVFAILTVEMFPANQHAGLRALLASLHQNRRLSRTAPMQALLTNAAPEVMRTRRVVCTAVLRSAPFYADVPAAILEHDISLPLQPKTQEELRVEFWILGASDRHAARQAAEHSIGLIAKIHGHGEADEHRILAQKIRPGLTELGRGNPTGYSLRSNALDQGWQLDSILLSDHD